MRFPFVIAKQVDDGSWWYEGADDTLEHASKVLFSLAKNCGHSLKNGKIIEVHSQEELDELREEVNNLPSTL